MAADAEPLPERCEPCEGGVPPMSEEEARARMDQVPGWELDPPRLRRRFEFKDFAEALAFVNRVGALAEDQGHHPDVHLTGYKNVELELTTHAIGGLSVNDFVMAKAIGELER